MKNSRKILIVCQMKKMFSTKEIDVLKSSFENIKKENISVTSELENTKEILNKFTFRKKRLDEMLAPQRHAFNKEGLGYNKFANEKPFNKSFKPSINSKELHKKCSHCKYLGHNTHTCPIRKGLLK